MIIKKKGDNAGDTPLVPRFKSLPARHGQNPPILSQGLFTSSENVDRVKAPNKLK
jgi:hypothetical protein